LPAMGSAEMPLVTRPADAAEVDDLLELNAVAEGAAGGDDGLTSSRPQRLTRMSGFMRSSEGTARETGDRRRETEKPNRKVLRCAQDDKSISARDDKRMSWVGGLRGRGGVGGGWGVARARRWRGLWVGHVGGWLEGLGEDVSYGSGGLVDAEERGKGGGDVDGWTRP